MAVADTAKLVVDLSLKGNFARAMKTNQTALDKFAKSEGRAFRAGQQIGTGIRRGAAIAAAGVGILVANVALGLDSLIELEQQQAQTNAVIKSTGGIAGITADEVGRLAEKYESLNATVGDEVIREGENLLLTFTNIRKEGFEPTLAAALDMNTALGKGADGLTGTIRILGKALNDPTKGLSALTRVGVTFTEEQQKRIKALQKEGDLYGAQSIILEELNKRFGGSFLAQGDTTAGKVAKFTDAVEDLQRSLATALLPVVGNVADALSELLQDPEVMAGVETLGKELGRLFSAENVKEGARIVGDVVSAIASAAPTIASGLSTAATVIGKVLSAFQKLPPEVQQLAIGAIAVNKLTGGLITNVAGAIFGALKSMTVQAAHVTVIGPGGGSPLGSLGGLGGAAGGGAAVGLGTITAALVGIPLAIAGLGIVLGRLNDPTGERTRAGAAATATARGVPDATNKNLDKVQKEINKQRSILTSIEANVLRSGERTEEGLVETKGEVSSSVDQTKQRVSNAVDTSKRLIAQKQQETTRETTRGATQTQAVQRSTAAAIQSTIRANRPIITVNVSVSATTVQKTVNVNSRSGPPGGSRDTHTGSKQAPP